MLEEEKKGRSRKKEEEEPFDLKKEIISWIQIIAAAVIIALVLNNFIIANSRVPSGSMENTIMTGDRIFGYRLAYGLNMDVFGHEISKKWKDPERFDIVIFKYPDDESQLFIKRIIGLPGDKVEIKDGKVYINDKELKSDVYGITDYIDYPGIAEEPITLGDDEYFCLGDNRPVSQDSRYEEVGPVKRSIIVGKVWIRIWPLNKFGKVS